MLTGLRSLARRVDGGLVYLGGIRSVSNHGIM